MKPQSEWSYFDRIFCINLPHRTDRRQQAQEQFDKVGIHPQWVSAVRHDDGRIGLIRTLLDIFTQNRDARNLLIFEDDVWFTAGAAAKLQLALNDLHEVFHDRYDMLYLGANLTEPCFTVTPNLKLIHNALAAHAVCYNHRMFGRYIKHLRRVSEQGFIATDQDISDVFLTTIQANGRSLLVHPIIATQRPSWSDIEKKFTDYSHLLKSQL
jgi:GR25 family glycosyltransferase involved in LPS biosynthesis